MKTYTHPHEAWTEAECEKRARHRGKDGYGTTYPYPGLVCDSATSYPGYGQTVRFNGGTVIDGKHYDAVSVPLPKIPDSYEFYVISSWGTFIRRNITSKEPNEKHNHPRHNH